jgi:8-oxo-dGTP pyrophosphatase MutT (NUDIX family)
MALRHWKRLSGRTVHTNPYWEYRCDEFELPSGVRGQYHYAHTHGAVMVIPVGGDGRIAMVRQYRYLVGGDSLEFVCGGVREGDTFEKTAREELAQEAGLRAERWTEVGSFVPFNGICDETCLVYQATGLSPAEAEPDETEEFERVQVTPEEIARMIGGGEIRDGMTLAAWALLCAQGFGSGSGAG